MNAGRVSPEAQALTDAYRASLVAVGMDPARPHLSRARTFFNEIGPEGWHDLSLSKQCGQSNQNRRVIGWLMVTGRLSGTADYLVKSQLRVGEMAGHFHPAFYARFCAMAADLGCSPWAILPQWSKLAKIAALHGVVPELVTGDQVTAGRNALVQAAARNAPGTQAGDGVSKDVYGMEATLFHLGVTNDPPTKISYNRTGAQREAEWASVAPRLRQTLLGYVEQVRVSLARLTVVRIEAVLREFACFLHAEAPEVSCVAEIRRAHIEAYKTRVSSRTTNGRSHRGQRLSKPMIAAHMSVLRSMLGASHGMGRRRRTHRRPGVSQETRRSWISPCPGFWMTVPPPSYWWPPGPTQTPSYAFPSRCWPEPGCARGSW